MLIAKSCIQIVLYKLLFATDSMPCEKLIVKMWRWYIGILSFINFFQEGSNILNFDIVGEMCAFDGTFHLLISLFLHFRIWGTLEKWEM